MPNWCYSKYAFYTNDENKDELLRLHMNLSDIIKEPSEVKNGFEPGWLGKVAISHGLNWEEVSCRGSIDYLDDYEPGNSFFTLESETAWAPTEELWEIVIGQYKGVSFVYKAEEPAESIYTNTDIEGTYFPEKYLLELYGDTSIPEGWFAGQDKPDSLDIREYFADFDELMDYCAEFTGKEFNTFEDLQNYFTGIFDGEIGVLVGIHEFTAT